jgi:hypothetical protein
MNYKLVAAFLIGLFFVSSCKKQSESTESPFNLKYSNLTTEQNKQNMEVAGIDFLNEVNSLPDEQFVDVLDYFSELDFDGVQLKNSAIQDLLKINSYSGSKNINGIISTATSSSSIDKLSNYFGVYTWRRSTSEWIKTSSTSKLEFIFPANALSLTNNAVLTFTYQIANTYTIDGNQVELPKSTSVILKMNNSELLKMTSDHEYKTDATPTKANVNLMLGAFNMNFIFRNDGTTATTSFTFNKGTKALIAFNVNANGNLSRYAYDNSLDPEEVVKNANATLEIMGYKFAGMVDFKTLSNEIDLINTTNVETAIKMEANLWNKYSEFVVVDKTSNSIVAKVEFEGISELECYTYYNPSLRRNVQQCYTNTYIDPLLVFNDGSKQNFDLFSDSGFSSLISKFEDFIDRL